MATVKDVKLPDIGDFEDVDVIEVLVSSGDSVNKDDSLITLESEKATMEVPSPYAGTVREIRVQVGDKISKGSDILSMEVGEDAAEADEGAEGEAPPQGEAAAPVPEKDGEEQGEETAQAPEKPAPGQAQERRPPPVPPQAAAGGSKPHASPSVRRFARELGVDLGRVGGSGRKGRILKEDVQAFVKAQLQGGAPAAGAGFPGIAPPPEIDFSQYGEVDVQPLSRIQQISGRNLHRNWVTIPHVTQFDEADISELEVFRKQKSEELKDKGIKLTPLAFFMKAAVAALREFPQFNASLQPDGQQLVIKKYYHIGIAVDTPQGLVVPVIRDADCKGLVDLAQELGEVSARARERKLSPEAMKGGSFSISSLGGIGGTAFTPIINAPEVAILGVSRAVMKPVHKDGEFVPRLMVPLSLSYDHRVIDGAAAARFTRYLCEVLADIRRLLL